MISGHPGTCARLCSAYGCGGPPANLNTLGVVESRWPAARSVVHHNEQLRSLFDAFGLKVGTSGPTHRLGGILYLVAATVDVSLSVDSVDCSDHSLIRWPVVSDPPTTPSVTVHTRSWWRLDPDAFRSRLMSSVLCQPSSWPIDVDATATLYDDTIRGILDDILPTRIVVRRPRPSDPWFYAECRAAKRLTRQLE